MKLTELVRLALLGFAMTALSDQFGQEQDEKVEYVVVTGGSLLRRVTFRHGAASRARRS